jgi:hypothetical protein
MGQTCLLCDKQLMERQDVAIDEFNNMQPTEAR